MSYKELTEEEIELVDKNISQPLEGLLYDLDLMPEQIKTDINNLRRIVIERLYEKLKTYEGGRT